MTLHWIGVGVLVDDDFGIAGEHRVDDAQASGAQRAAGFGDVDYAVGDVGNLGLAGAVREPDVGFDALFCEVATGEFGVFGAHPQPLGKLVNCVSGRIASHCDNHPNRQ